MLGFPFKPVLCLGIDVALNRFTLVSYHATFLWVGWGKGWEMGGFNVYTWRYGHIVIKT